MPVTIDFDPTSTSRQSQIIPNATPANDGVMTRAQAAQLAMFGKGSFAVLITQPADGSDFIVSIPAANQIGTASYKVSVTIATANIFTGIAIPLADQTPTQFRVTTDGDLPSGTTLLCSLEKIS